MPFSLDHHNFAANLDAIHTISPCLSSISVPFRSYSRLSSMDPPSYSTPPKLNSHPFPSYETSPPRTQSPVSILCSFPAAPPNDPQPNTLCDEEPQITASANSASADRENLDGIDMRLWLFIKTWSS